MAEDPQLTNEYAIETEALDIYYGNFRAVKETTLKIEQKKITAIIGPLDVERAPYYDHLTG